MTKQALYEFFADLVAYILEREYGNAAPAIFRAGQNRERPSAVYVVLDDGVATAKHGRASEQVVLDKDGNPSFQYDNDYVETITLWEVNSHGENLQTIIDYLDDEDVRAMLFSAGVGILKPGTVNKTNWIATEMIQALEYRVQIEVSVRSRRVSTGTYIEQVEWTKEINH